MPKAGAIIVLDSGALFSLSHTWPRPPVAVDRRIAPPTAAPERSVPVSVHSAPQCPGACHAYRPRGTHHVPEFSHHGRVPVRLGDCYSGNPVDAH
jgi:hypothetical protein